MQQSEIIERLAQGEAFGGEAPERIDTHISVVLLTAKRAYKLKRAIRTSYLDYSELSARRRFCKAEIAVNRRTAPDIYLQATAVTLESDGKLAIGGDGETVEWLVEMVRFDTGNTFDRLASGGGLDEDLVRRLADEIAAFHARAEAVDTGDGIGIVSPLIAANDGELRDHAGQPFEVSEIEALAHSQETQAVSLAPLLDRRATEGRVRRCHGDLHLRNICLIDGKPTIFDAIEFNDAFSNIDVLYDLAFLLMDFAHGGHRDYANLAMNRYLLRSDETGGLAALPLFMSLRAAIRAHVTAKAAGEQSSDSERMRMREEARAYLSLARDVLDAPAPRVVAIGGFSGTGKSTLARRLAPTLRTPPGALVLSSDPVRKRLLGAAPEERLGPDAYRPDIDERVFGQMFAETATALKAGFPVILDMTFRDPDLRARAETVAGEAGVPFAGFWLEAARDTLADRVEKRRGDASDATVAVLERQIASGAGSINWPRIDTSVSIAESHDRVAAAVAALSEPS
ncbi:MAG: AAA family ATPase [Rhodospirillaceae bacterium]